LHLLAWMSDPSGWAALLTLTLMEIVLGIDNVVFISLLITKLPADLARRARSIGLILAFVMRVVLLTSLTWLMGLTAPIVVVMEHHISWHDVILMAGGLFLVWKATTELHDEVERAGREQEADAAKAPRAFGAAILQIALIDLVFSIDSIVTAIGMAQDLAVMILAVLLSMAVMYWASGGVARFIQQHPTTKVLALSFLVLIGVSLMADGGGFHIPRGYIYSAMAFATCVEMINVWSAKRRRGR